MPPVASDPFARHPGCTPTKKTRAPATWEEKLFASSFRKNTHLAMAESGTCTPSVIQFFRRGTKIFTILQVHGNHTCHKGCRDGLARFSGVHSGEKPR